MLTAKRELPMRRYCRMTPAEREEISRCLVLKLPRTVIARRLNRSLSTITREIGRNGGVENYRLVAAQNRAKRQGKRRRRRRKLDSPVLWNFVDSCVSLRWSPKQIAKTLTALYPDNRNMQVSHETIYRYVYIYARPRLRQRVVAFLRRRHRHRRERKEKLKTSPIQDYVSIDQRPVEVNDRKIPGHWEGDLMIGARNGSAIGTLVERTTRYTIIVKLKGRDAVSVREAFEEKFNSLPDAVKRSLTYDQGQEMAQHKEFTKNTRITVYFAHPHSPWERGTNENTNGLIRDFFPKGTDFNKVPADKLDHIATLLNERPRGVLNWSTPKQAFDTLLH